MTREKIGAALACQRYDRNQDTETTPWQGINLSTINADRAFEMIEAELSTYKVIDSDSPPMVKTPSGEEISCWGYYSD